MLRLPWQIEKRFYRPCWTSMLWVTCFEGRTMNQCCAQV